MCVCLRTPRIKKGEATLKELIAKNIWLSN